MATISNKALALQGGCSSACVCGVDSIDRRVRLKSKVQVQEAEQRNHASASSMMQPQSADADNF